MKRSKKKGREEERFVLVARKLVVHLCVKTKKKIICVRNSHRDDDTQALSERLIGTKTY